MCQRRAVMGGFYLSLGAIWEFCLDFADSGGFNWSVVGYVIRNVHYLAEVRT